MKFLRVVAVVACVASLALADDVWKKEPKSWSKEDANEIITNSPWGKRVATAEEFAKESSENKSSGGKNITSATDRGDLRPTDFATVVWWSARTPRRAYLRMFELSGQQVTPEQAQEFAEAEKPTFDVVIWGGGKQVDLATRLKEEDLMKAAWLETPRVKKLLPVKAEVVKNASGRADRVVFQFPKQVDGQPTVTVQDKKIIFKWKLPKSDKETVDKAKQFDAQFQPNKMNAGGQVDL